MIPDTNEKAPSTIWVDNKRVRKTLSNTSFKEVTIYQAHSESSPGLIPYVGKNYHDKIVQALELKIQQLQGTNINDASS